MYKAGIFDLDGTLADTVDSMAYSANLALRELGLLEQPAERFKTFAGDGAEELIRRCLRAGGDETCSKFEEMQRLYRSMYRSMRPGFFFLRRSLRLRFLCGSLRRLEL